MKKTLFLLAVLASFFIQDVVSQTPYLKYNCDAITSSQLVPTLGGTGITATFTDNSATPLAKTDASIVTDGVRGNVLYLPNTIDPVTKKGDQPSQLRCLRITSASSLVGTGDYTFSFFAKINAPDPAGLGDNGFPQVFLFDGASFELRDMQTNSNPQITYTGGSILPSITLVSMKSWHQYVFVKSGTNLNFYVDNVSKGSASNFNVTNASLLKLRFNGSAHGGGTLFDDIQIFQQNLATTISSQPTNLTINEGQAATFTVAATGLNLNYQWKKGTTNVGTSSPTLSIPVASISDAGTYSVVVTGGAGVVTSSNAVLTINVATTITTQPTNQAATVGQPATFTVGAAGVNLHYQWKKGSTNVGTDSPTFSIPSVNLADASSYSVVVTGDIGAAVTSSSVTLTVNLVTIITKQPFSQFVAGGKNVTFTIEATGTNQTYQWKKDGSIIAAATNAIYTINTTQASDAGIYTVVVTGDGGTVTSFAVKLTVCVEPVLSKKSLQTASSDVTAVLASAKNSVTVTDVRDVNKISLTTLPSEYTVEVRARINSSTGRGLDIEARDASKAGFRFAVNTQTLNDYSDCNNSVNYVTPAEIGTVYHTYRYAVKAGKATIYMDNTFVGIKDTTANMEKNNLIDNGGFELATTEGWTNPTWWGFSIDPTLPYKGKSSLAFTAWHSGALIAQYSTPIPAGSYTCSFYNKLVGGQAYRWNLALADATYTNGVWNGLTSAGWEVKTATFTAVASTTATLSFWEWNNGSSVSIDELKLVEAEASTITPYLAFGKAFGKGTADMDIEYVNYDLTGAYAPIDLSTTNPQTLANEASMRYTKGNLFISNAKNIKLQVFSLTGDQLLSQNVSGSIKVPVQLKQGVYIAKLGAQVLKFIVE